MRTLRRVKVKRAAGAAFDASGRLWVSATNARLYPVHPYVRKKAVGRPLKLGRGVGGAIATSPDGRRLLVGAAATAPRASLVDPFARKVHGLRAGPGPGRPGWSPDGIRAYLADGGAGALSVVSPLRGSRLGSIGLPPGSLPGGVVVQPGLATVPGTPGDDKLLGTRLRDLLEGYGGNDTLSGGRDNDVLHGDEGDDTMSGGSYDDRLLGGDGTDRVLAGSGNDRIEAGPGNDVVNGGTGDDSVHGDDGDDLLDGGDGDDRILGEEGDDRIVEAGFGNDRRVYGGPGNDYISLGRGSDRANGGARDDPKPGGQRTRNPPRPRRNHGIDGGHPGGPPHGHQGDHHNQGGPG